MDNIISFLQKNNVEFFEDIDLSQISSIKIGNNAKIAVFPNSKKQLLEVIKWFYNKNIYFKLVGNASNLLFLSNLDYPVVVTSKMCDEISLKGQVVDVSAGVLISRLSDYLKKNELSGFEGRAGIPASIGGAIVNGAGAFGYNIYDY